MKNIVKPGAVTRIGELIEADNKTYGEETRERNARQRKWKPPAPDKHKFYREHRDLHIGGAPLFIFLFCVAVAAFSKFLALLAKLNPI